MWLPPRSCPEKNKKIKFLNKFILMGNYNLTIAGYLLLTIQQQIEKKLEFKKNQ